MEDGKLSKFLSTVLRHKPGKVGIDLDEHGWADVGRLIEGCNKFLFLDRIILDRIVASDDQHRFGYNESSNKIRANYGHSVPWQPDNFVEPPDMLWHGTATKYENSIDRNGLVAKNRAHVHLSKDIAKATRVGKRHGELLLYQIDAKAMVADGFLFAMPVEGVYLTKDVPVKYLKKMSQE